MALAVYIQKGRYSKYLPSDTPKIRIDNWLKMDFINVALTTEHSAIIFLVKRIGSEI